MKREFEVCFGGKGKEPFTRTAHTTYTPCVMPPLANLEREMTAI